MSLVFPAVHDARLEADTREPVTLLAPDQHRDAADAAYEDAELLLTSILPDARIEHVGATAVAGARSRGGVDVCVAVPRGAFDEALAVLVEAGCLQRSQEDAADRHAALAMPSAALPVTLQLIETGSVHESLMRVRDALRADAALMGRLNAAKAGAAGQGDAAYAAAKARFFEALIKR
ncbi:MAG TPA: GrpB family protein [Burkholderiaceae bacterium]